MAVIDVFGIPLGSKPTAKAFRPGGELEVERGRRDGDRWVPFKAPVFFPLNPDICTFAYPEGSGFIWRNINAHYTPETREMDFVEVWDYFASVRTTERDVREKALGLLASAVAKAFPDGRVAASSRFVRYTEQYVVVTQIRLAEPNRVR